MSDEVRVWLVERDYNDRDLIIHLYATPDGDRVFRRELAAAAMDRMSVTAARDVPEDDLESVDDAETRERYAEEAGRMADEHAPTDDI